MDNNYTPISCTYYDQLEVLALRRLECQVEFLDEQDQQQSARDVIVDIYSKDKQEFLRLRSGAVIRLDRLLTVDGKPMPDHC